MNSSQHHGLIIAGVGLPGSGKSSVIKALASLENCKVFLEPEEEDWPDAVKNRKTCGLITAITWFRSMRVPKLYDADELRMRGEKVFIDSIYDKLAHYWIGRDGMDWLFPSTDTYFNVLQEMARLDRHYLPDPDVILLLEIDEHDWRKFVCGRGRALDREEEFLASHHTQKRYIEAAEKYAKDEGIQLIRYKQKPSSPHQAASDLREKLRSEGIL